MTVEFYLDYLCPKCYIQHKVLEDMVKDKQLSPADIIYRSYEMVYHETFDSSISFIDFIATYKHLPQDEVIAFLKEQNIDISVFPIHNVHKMAHLAKKEGKSFIYSKAVFQAIYEDRLDLSDNDTLTSLAISIGLPREKVVEVLTTDKFSNAVISNKENAQLKGVADLPFLRINKHVKLSGLCDEYDIIAAMNRERLGENEHCVGDNCERHRSVS